MPQIREQIAMVHLPPSKTLKYLFHVRKTKLPYKNTGALFFTNSDCLSIKNGKIIKPKFSFPALDKLRKRC